MPRRLVVAALLLLATCTVPNPEYCDATRGCAEGFLCDLAGTVSSDGRTNVCVRQVSCVTDPALCVAPTPICSEGLCVACLGPGDCGSPGAGICDDGACRGCEMDEECQPPGPGKCLVGSCVECIDTLDCSGGTLCDAVLHTCRGCRADSECASSICDAGSERCVDPLLVAYVAQGAPAGNVACTLAAPCDGLDKGLTRAAALGTGSWIRVGGGMYMGNHTITQVVSISAPDAELRPTSAASPVLTVGPGGTLVMQGGKITGAGLMTSGVACLGTIDVTLATLELREMNLSGNLGLGLQASYCDLTVERSRIQDNPQGGVNVSRSNFTLVNDLLTGNGTAGIGVSSTTLGGVNVENSPYLTPPRARFEHNTVVANKIRDSVAGAAVRCELNLGTITLRSSILYDNVGPAEISPACALAYSDVEQLGISGTGVINMPPLLDANFHLGQLSPCRDKADPLSSVTVDFDGDIRPAGTADMGFDEYR